jgi:type II secretory pathway component PulC
VRRATLVLLLAACEASSDSAPAPAPAPTEVAAAPGIATVTEARTIAPTATAAVRISDRLYWLPRAAVAEVLAEALAARIRVEAKDGGWRIAEMDPGALAARLGLRVGDVVRTVDERALPHADAVLELVRSLPAAEEVVVALDRDGVPVEIRYALRDADPSTRSEIFEQLVALVRLGVDAEDGRSSIDRACLDVLARVDLVDALRPRQREALLRALQLHAPAIVAVDGAPTDDPRSVLAALAGRASADTFTVDVRTDFGARPRTIQVVAGRVDAADLALVVQRFLDASAKIGSPDPPTRDPALGESVDPAMPERPDREAADVGIVAVDETHYEVPRALAEELAADPSGLAKMVRIVPAVEDGDIVGFKLYGIRRGSAPKWIGLKNGDTIRAVNGMELGSMEDAMRSLTKLRKAKTFEIEVVRKDKPFTIHVKLTG